jgi:cyanophycin synthetase
MNNISYQLVPNYNDMQSMEGPIKLRSKRIFKGCNIYHANTVIRQRVDFGILTGTTSALAGPEFASGFLDRFRGLKTFLPENGLTDDFVERLNSPEGVSFEEILLQAILAVEASLAFAMHDLETVAYAVIEKHAKYVDLIWESANPKLSHEAAEVALLGVLSLLPRRLFLRPRKALPNFSSELEEVAGRARRRRLSPATSVIKLAARKRGLPCETVGRQHLRIGQGNAQHHLYSSMTSTTSIAAQKMCSDKRLTNRRLSELRLPVPQQIKVGSADSAHDAAAKLSFPIVIKPVKGKKGRAVTAGLDNPNDIDAAFERAHVAKSDVLVEQFLPGVDHRLLVIGGKFIAALLRIPPTITGDGETTVEALIDELNSDPRRDGFRLFKVAKDAEVTRLLSEAGLTMNDVLGKGRTVALRSAANVSTGGLPIDVTDQVHPDNREMAERAAKGVGLDVAGIDFVTTDITRSYREVGGGIIELNARPGLDIHIWPYKGVQRNVAGEVLNLLFASGAEGRIPIVAVAGDKATGATARTLDTILRGADRNVALALRDRSFVDGVSSELSETQQTNAAQILLRDPEIDTLVSTVSLRQVARSGLVLETCNITVIMDKAKDGEVDLFHRGIDVMQRATTDCFVVGAGNIVALNRLRELGSRRLILVSDRIDHPVLQAHLSAGHQAVTMMWRDGEERIVLLSGTKLLASLQANVAMSRDGRKKIRRLKNGKMYAVAAAFALGLSGNEIAGALSIAPCIVPEVD